MAGALRDAEQAVNPAGHMTEACCCPEGNSDDDRPACAHTGRALPASAGAHAPDPSILMQTSDHAGAAP